MREGFIRLLASLPKGKHRESRHHRDANCARDGAEEEAEEGVQLHPRGDGR